LAYLVALGPVAASATDAIAAMAAKAVLGEWAGKLVAATILISVFSSTNSVILTAPRVFYAMAKDNLFFKKLAEIHPRFQTPAASVISLGVLAAILTQAGKFSELVEGVIFVGWIFYGLAGAAIFPLRQKLAGKTLPYKVPGYPWTPILFVLSAIAIVGNAIYRATIDPAQFRHVLAALAILAAGVPVYLFWRRKSAAKPAN
jgi:APA family basic amino acid/polyamine antiporter